LKNESTLTNLETIRYEFSATEQQTVKILKVLAACQNMELAFKMNSRYLASTAQAIVSLKILN